jgi:hypothetical protein
MTTTAGAVVPALADESVVGDRSPGPEATPEVHTTTAAGAVAPSMASEVVVGGCAGSTDPKLSWGTPFSGH